MDSGTRQHVHQGIDAEEIDTAPDKIADPRLRDSEKLGSLHLSDQSPIPLPRGTFPTPWGAFPDAQGAFPNALGMFPDAWGVFPDPLGMLPFVLGVFPNALGVFPNALGAFPKRKGTLPFALGTFPVSRARYRNQAVYLELETTFASRILTREGEARQGTQGWGKLVKENTSWAVLP